MAELKLSEQPTDGGVVLGKDTSGLTATLTWGTF
jgi:hypothetical protein